MAEGPRNAQGKWRWRNVPLPEAHLGGLVVGLVLQPFAPWKLFSASWLGHAMGWPVLLAGVLLAIWAVMAAGRVDMQAPNQIVARGPYARSRNPMYVAWSIMYVGAALIVNAAWPLVALPAVLLFMHIAVVREERHLERRFGAEFEGYLAQVRRYI
ncbi:MAG: isoprenylcysteine carboxylmethyltransferase family protein [Actinobacteria bacterium]|nr:isoprenylcysteine carboxylmethyltransferase family protein [Actinomycetota bacterium]